jgi:type VI secretion system protein ImpA
MVSQDVLDFASLLTPISEAEPTGVDPRSDASASTAYRAVRDLRNAARDIERRMSQGDDTGGKVPDWRGVQSKAEDFLQALAKDYDIGAWLIEALARLEGFAGLRDGFRLMREMAENWWDGLYPRPDEDGVRTRVSALTGLNGEDRDGTLIVPINSIPITEGSSVGPYSKADYEAAKMLDEVADPERKQQRIDAGAPTVERVKQAVRETPAKFYHRLVADIDAAIAEWDKLGDVLRDKCGADGDGMPLAPPASNVRRAMSDVLETVRELGADKLAAPAPDVSAGSGEAAGAAAGGMSTGAAATNGAWNRDEALRRIEEIARIFRHHEPQSLVPHALDQAVKWGRMSLKELLENFVPEQSARNKFEWIGIGGSEEGSSESSG